MTVLDATWTAPPSLGACMSKHVGQLHAGTLSRLHLTRMAFGAVGKVEVIALPERSWSAAHPDSAAIHDISIANHLSIPTGTTGSHPKLGSLVRI